MVTSALRSVGRWGRTERCGKDLGGLAMARLAAQEEGLAPRGHLNHQACRQVPPERVQTAKPNSGEAGGEAAPRGAHVCQRPEGMLRLLLRGRGPGCRPAAGRDGDGPLTRRVWVRPSSSLERSLQTYLQKSHQIVCLFLLKKCSNTPHTQQGDCSVD